MSNNEREGTVDRIQYTSGGAGNQWIVIDGVRYAAWWDVRTKDWKVGDRVRFEHYRRPLWADHPAVDCAQRIRKAA